MPTVKSDRRFVVECACPYCGADLHAQAVAWEQRGNHTWQATELDVECSQLPHPENHQEWKEFMNEHTQEVYERWHPLVDNILTHIQLKYSFDLENDNSIVY